MTRSDGRGVSLHPDIPNHFVHFTGRPLGTNTARPSAHAGTAEERLRMILSEGRLRAFVTYQSPPVVCVCEVTRPAANVLLSKGVTGRGPYEPWGVVLSRQACIGAGARPVLHLSTEEIERLKSQRGVSPPMHWRAVRHDPPATDWTHEREWRFGFRAKDHDPHVSLAGLITGIIVGRKGWEPTEPMDWAGGQVVKRYLWDGARLVDDQAWTLC